MGNEAQSLKLTLSKYLLVGVLNTLVHFAITIALVELAMWQPIIASIIGFCAAVVVSFTLNSLWTFAQTDALPRRFVRFILVSVSGLLLNTIIMYLAVNICSLHYLLGLMVIVVVIPVYSFTLNYYWSFR